MTAVIVKVQVAQFPPGAPALIYAKDRKRLVQMELPADVTRQMRGAAKAYFRAVWTGDGCTLRERVADQSW
jgi:hypothetical protein